MPYREAVPPFSIKNRGSILLLNNKTGASIDWHRGYPSTIQMLAASGHTVVSADLPKATSAAEKVSILESLAVDKNLTRLTIVASGDAVQQVIDLTQKLR